MPSLKVSRHIEQKMVDFIDGKLKENGLAQQAIADKNARLVFRLAAQACVGIREVGGNNKGPMVELIQETIGNAAREAWCMAFVQTCLAYAETKTGVSSPVPASEHCLTVWQTTPTANKVKKIPAPGAICVYNYPPTANGHTGIVDQYRDADKTMNLYEGNTESGLAGKKVVRDGGGVYYTQRSTKSTPKTKILGFIIPF